MSSNFTVDKLASVQLVIGRRQDGVIVAGVRAEMPGIPAAVDGFSAAADEWDEMNSLMADWHNCWKGWGQLTDVFLGDLATTQLRFPT